MGHTRAWAVATLLTAASLGWALEPCGEWQQVLPWPTGAVLNAVAVGDGRVVAVGCGVALTSDDGVVWSAWPLDPGVCLQDVIWVGDRFLAVGGRDGTPGESVVATSRDGTTWGLQGIGSGALRSVAWDGRALVAVGHQGLTPLLVHSADGEVWTPVNAVGALWLLGVSWGNGVWVAVGDHVLRSADGLQWEAVAGEGLGGRAVVWAGDRFVAIGQGATLVSPDGAAWSAFSEPDLLDFAKFITWNGRRLLAGGGSDDQGRGGRGMLTVSVDGSTWSTRVDVPFAVHAGVWTHGRWVIVGDRGLVGSSADGQAWRWLYDSPHKLPLRDVAAHGPSLVAVGGEREGNGAIGTILASEGGVGWALGPDAGCPLLRVEWAGEDAAGGHWLAVGRYGCVGRLSEDGWWTSLGDLGVDREYWAVASSGETAVLIGGNALQPFLTLLSGDELTDLAPPGYGTMADVLWTGAEFVLVGEGVTGSSADGRAWSFRPGSGSLRRLATNGRRLVAVGLAGIAAWSDDGETWTPAPTGTTADLSDVTWAGDRFLAGSLDGTLVQSADGVAWESAEPFPFPDLQGLAWSGRELGAVTGYGTIARRRCSEENLLPDSAPRLVVPVAAHRPGLGGTAWRTDLAVVSPGDHWSEVWVGLVATGAAAPTWQRFLLPPGGQLDRADVVSRTFALDDAAGPLLIASEQELAVASRSFTEEAAGTYGELFPAFAEADALTGGRVAVLPMLEQDTAFRTNLGLTNLGAAPVTVRVELLDAAGSPLGDREVELGPLAWVQLDGALGAGPVADASALVSADDLAARFVAYASVIDNATGDPTLVLPTTASSEPLLLPAVSHGAGAAGTFWRSDLEVANPGPSDASYRLELLAGDVVASPAFSLAPGASRRHADVVASAFAASGNAALRVVPTAGAVAATSRTFTAGGGGTYGQGIPAVPESGSEGAVALPGLEESVRFRTNLGLVNPGDSEVAATVELYRGDGSLAGALQETVPARSLAVLSRVFARVGATELDSGYAVVRTDTAGARLLAWASVVDNATGDPSFVLGR
jgi:hypothetical protein